MMTPEENRIRIAELDGIAIGWECTNPDCAYFGTVEDSLIICSEKSLYCPGNECGNDLSKTDIPDYLNNRDAIVEAIKRRFRICADKFAFEDALQEILGDDYTDFGIATASAEQLADAYLEAAI